MTDPPPVPGGGPPRNQGQGVPPAPHRPRGQHAGAPGLKGPLLRRGGRALRTFAPVGPGGGANACKAYSPEFLREGGIAARDGFEIGTEPAPKAKRLRLPVAEIPTIWLD